MNIENLYGTWSSPSLLDLNLLIFFPSLIHEEGHMCIQLPSASQRLLSTHESILISFFPLISNYFHPVWCSHFPGRNAIPLDFSIFVFSLVLSHKKGEAPPGKQIILNWKINTVLLPHRRDLTIFLWSRCLTSCVTWVPVEL